MRIYEAVKQTVTVRQAAERYGLKVGRNGMACCPFHEDRNPSLKLNEDYFYCFGCGAKGDVIDFTARLFGLSGYEAVNKLADDFGVDLECRLHVPIAAKTQQSTQFKSREDEAQCFRVLTDYLQLLHKWRKEYAPTTPDEALDDHFVKALQMTAAIEHLLDLLTGSDKEVRKRIVELLMQDGKIAILQNRIERSRKEEKLNERSQSHDLAI